MSSTSLDNDFEGLVNWSGLRNEWNRRTWYGKLRLSPTYVAAVILWSILLPLVLAVAVKRSIEPSVYQDETESDP